MGEYIKNEDEVWECFVVSSAGHCVQLSSIVTWSREHSHLVENQYMLTWFSVVLVLFPFILSILTNQPLQISIKQKEKQYCFLKHKILQATCDWLCMNSKKMD